jgi:hypothetical protein
MGRSLFRDTTKFLDEREAELRAQAEKYGTTLPTKEKRHPLTNNTVKKAQQLFKDWRPEMGLPAVKPECWSSFEWAQAVALRPERYSAPLWVEVVGDMMKLAAAGAVGMKAAWNAFREEYDRAYEDAKRAHNRNSNRGEKSNHPTEPSKTHRSPYSVLGVRENAPWSEVKSAYRKAMMNLHPDRISQTGMDPTKATARTQEVNAAYVDLESRLD